MTSWARMQLQRAVDLAGDQFVYTDTDSVKFVGEVDFADLNDELQALSWSNGAYAPDANGEVHYMGVFEHDGSYSDFCTLGAKKYAYVEDEKLHITVAGVSKKTGAAELEKKGGIKAFNPGLVFEEAGGTESRYNDHPAITGVQMNGQLLPAGLRGPVLEISGHRLEITSNVVIRDSTYSLDITQEYRDILKNSYLFEELYKSLFWY